MGVNSLNKMFQFNLALIRRQSNQFLQPFSMETKSSNSAIELRQYQRRIVEQSKNENIIVRLPTGAGKTLIAAEIIREAHQNHERALMLVPSRILVKQQARALENWLNQHNAGAFVGRYHGELTIPTNFDVLVTTPKAFEIAQAKQKNTVQSSSQGSLMWDSFAVVIFDEVHHMLKDHPYRKLTTALNNLRARTTGYSLPRIVGLTASLTYAIDEVQIKKGIDSLCFELGVTKIYQASHQELTDGGYKGTRAIAEVCVADVRTPEDRGLLSYKERKPHLMSQIFARRIANGNATEFTLQMNACIVSLENYAISLDASFVSPRNSKSVSDWEKNTHKLAMTKKSQPVLSDVLLELSMWYGAIKLLVVSWEEADYAAIELLKMHKIPELYTQHYESSLFISVKRHTPALHSQFRLFFASFDSHSEERYKQLKHKLCQEFDKLQLLGIPFRGIVFVEQRIATHILDYVIQTDLITSTRFISKVVYSAGSPASPTHHLSKSNQEAALESFQTGESNLLIATNVAEEGLDVPAANCVIRFDSMVTSVSLTQSRGRARQADSSFIVLSERADRTTRDLERAEQIQMEVCANYKVVQKTAKETDQLLQVKRQKQRNREVGVLPKINAQIANHGGVDETNSLSLLNIICKSTKVNLQVLFSDGKLSLTYDSVLRKRTAEISLQNRDESGGKRPGKKAKKIAKRRAALELLQFLRTDFN